MKRQTLILIVVATLLILLVIGFWLYSLLTGQPGQTDRFTDFPWGSGEVSEFPNPVPEEVPEENLINITGNPLRQLTFRPVIGYQEISKDDVRFIRYVEAGTGHIYDINLVSGQEDRISNITVPNAHEAIINPSGENVIIRSGFLSTSDIIIVELNAAEPTSRRLENTMNSFAFDLDNRLIYTTRTNTGLEARRYNLTTNGNELLFSIPFLSATIQWTTAPGRPHLIYTKPASELTGYAYEVNGVGTLVRLPFIGQGLTAIHSGAFIAYSTLSGMSYQSFMYNRQTGEIASAPIITLPEKCTLASDSTEILFCGHQITTYDSRFPDEWYKGVRQFADSLWLVDMNRQSAIQLINPGAAVGRELDMTTLTHTIHENSDMVYFINRTDKTLWVYEYTP
jgi:hypothetical protein